MAGKLAADPDAAALCSLQDAVRRAAEEAAIWAESVAALERQIEKRGSHASLLTELQSLDRVRQGLAGLTTFLRMVADRADPALPFPVGPILRVLDMEEQASRLAGRGVTRQAGAESSIDLWHE
ncbi:hypothetical protein [Paracoccus tibetensis]|nr:hypothetical protein [Paracoccus tibetensis]